MIAFFRQTKPTFQITRQRAELWKPRFETLENRCVLSGYRYATFEVPYLGPEAINDAGQIVGSYGRQGFLLSGGSYTTLDVPGSSGTSATGINDAGQIVGYYDVDGAYNSHGFLLSGGSYTTLDVPGSNITYAEGINDAGQIVGYYEDSGYRYHGFLLSGGSYTTLDVPGSYGYSFAFGINNAGQISGRTGGSGFLLDGDNYITLRVSYGGFTSAYGINNAGQIVGDYSIDTINIYGFLATPTTSDIVVDSVQTTDSRSVTVEYDITDAIGAQSFDIGIFRSPTQTFDPDPRNHYQLGTLTVSGDDVAVGHHTRSITLDDGIPIDTHFRYVLAVADPEGHLPDVDIDNRAYFRTYVIGAVTEGLDPKTLVPGRHHTADRWVPQMADTLRQLGYDDAIPFGWPSAALDPEAVLTAGYDLYSEIEQSAENLDGLGPNDVIDVHLIGHSRGAVVISLAMDYLLAYSDFAPLLHGYFKMTLLDPHPANNQYGLNANIGNTRIGQILQYAYPYFQDIVQDPGVEVPPRVNEAELLWQHTGTDRFYHFEKHLNLWGLDPRLITIDRTKTRVTREEDLTDQFWIFEEPYIGHTQVHEYYQWLLNSGMVPSGEVGREKYGSERAPVAVLPSGSSSEPPSLFPPQASLFPKEPVLPILKSPYINQYFTSRGRMAEPFVPAPSRLTVLALVHRRLRPAATYGAWRDWLEPIRDDV